MSTFAVTPFVVRALGADQYGVVGIGITLYQVGLVIVSLGFPAAITRHAIVGSSGPAGASGLTLVGAVGAILLGALAAATSGWWAGLVIEGQSPALLIAPVVSSVGLGIVMLAQSFLRGVDRVREFVLLGMMAAILPPLSGLIFILGGEASAARYLWPMAIAHVTVGLIALLGVVRLCRPVIVAAEIRRSLWIGLPTLPHQMATSVLTVTLVVSAGSVVGVASAGALQLALLLGTAPMVVIGAFNNAWAPLIYRTPDDDRKRVLTETTWLVSMLCLVLVTGYASVAPLLAFFIGGAAGASILPPSLVAAAGASFMVVYLAHVHLVFLRGRTWPLALTTPTSVAVALAVVYLVLHVTGVDDLRLFALALPLFYGLQSVAAILLARTSGYDLPRLSGSIGFLVAASACCIALAFLSPPPVVGILAFCSSVAFVAFFVLRWRRRTQDSRL
ncbi:hypothetical protein [Microbacterium sp. CJ77]|uniref:hypothetical protein n=1 Tax=Microbacterium sp. CJ77 TaxID=2079201 RepID=UPI0011AFBE5B|nr:hypothetical protein [Microbacterium sp. CJ77]